jgi:hypothetical protein
MSRSKMCFEIWMREVHVDLEVFQMPRMVMIMYKKKKVEEVNRADKDDQLVENLLQVHRP